MASERSVLRARRLHAVMKVPINGGPTTTLASGQSNATGIAMDATAVYWLTTSWAYSGSTDVPTGAVMKVSKF